MEKAYIQSLSFSEMQVIHETIQGYEKDYTKEFYKSLRTSYTL